MIVSGNIVHSTENESMKILENYCIGVKNGKIVFVEPEKNLNESLVNEHKLEKCPVLKLQKGQFMMPGMVDTHIHASQYPNAGKGLDMQLLDWLNAYTFPTESKYIDLTFASDVYQKVVNATLRNGTTTACYFATIHTDASLQLCDIIDKLGQRALVGKVNMNQNSPEYYVETTQESLTETRRFVTAVLQRKNPRIMPVITPRFAPSCTTELMKGLCEIAKENQIHIQSHVSENQDECSWIAELYPDSIDYVDVYDKVGLLTNKTILAHGVYLSDRERKVLKERGTAISHCPNSNLSIRSGVLDVQQLLKENMKVGLGTDVSGGYSCSILDAMRTAIYSSNVHAIQKTDYQPITHREAFMMATLGGARSLALEDRIGNFLVGKEFDALLVDVEAADSPINVFDDDSVEDYIQKFIYIGDSRNIKAVYVSGEEVLRLP